MPRHIAILFACGFVITTGCARQVFSPPAGYPGIEGPDRLEEGRSTIGGSFGGGGLGISDVDIYGGNVKYRRGLGAVELQAEGAFAVIAEDSEGDTFPAILSARVGVKGRLIPGSPHFSWRSGVGFGGSAGGMFGAVDVGLTAGYENPYVVPFLTVFGNVSVPFTSEDVDITPVDDEDDTVYIDHPVTSFGAGFTLGAAVPIGSSDGRINLGLTRLQLYDIHGEDEGLIQLMLGFEVPL